MCLNHTMIDRTNSGGSLLAAQIPFAVVVFIAGLGYYAGQPPRRCPPRPARSLFSAARALAHSQILSREPHPAGSEALEHGRDYTPGPVEALRRRGGDPTGDGYHGPFAQLCGECSGTNPRHEQQWIICPDRPLRQRVFGTRGGDDGAGVITMLETARALMAGPRLANDVVFAFTGDEERGHEGHSGLHATSLGARTLGWCSGWKGAGTHGPSYMFETSARESLANPTIAQGRCAPAGQFADVRGASAHAEHD